MVLNHLFDSTTHSRSAVPDREVLFLYVTQLVIFYIYLYMHSEAIVPTNVITAFHYNSFFFCTINDTRLVDVLCQC